jgi:deoxyribodipyrimidine photo-lyase
MKKALSIFWFRRDLRFQDNVGLYHALYAAKKEGHAVLPLFIFDKTILDLLEDKSDRRVDFIHQTLQQMQSFLVENGKSLWVQHGKPLDVFKTLLKTFSEKYTICSVYTNHDYEPKAIERDNQIEQYLKEQGVPFLHYKDQVIFEKEEVIKDDGTPYTIYTPYANKWRAAWAVKTPKKFPSEKLLNYFFDSNSYIIYNIFIF